jgi:hypothetical protein
MTGMYNVLEKLRSGESLTPADRTIHEQGLVSVLRQLHDDLDAAVCEAYGWPVTLTDQQILEKLVALNAERAAEEANGQIRWLRPEYQNAAGGKAEQGHLGIETVAPGRPSDTPREGAHDARRGRRHAVPPSNDASASHREGERSEPATRPSWPKTLPDQVRVLRDLLAAQSAPVTAKILAKSLLRAREDKVEELLQTLVTLGQARQAGDGKYTAG